MRIKGFILYVIISCLLLSNFTVINADGGGSDGSWVDVLIKQGDVDHPSGCTVCTFQMIFQNSKTLKSEYQLSGKITSYTDAYAKFDKICINTIANTDNENDGTAGDGWLRDGFIGFSDTYCDGTFSIARLDNGKENADYTAGIVCITGVGDKDFHSMEKEELLTAMKMIFNQGLWGTFCVSYVGNQAGNSGPEGYGANHATMFAGVTDDGIYLADPATGTVFNYFDSKTHRNGTEYKLEYMLIMKNSKNSPLSLSGGNKAGASDDEANALGLDSAIVNGTRLLDENSLSSYVRLAEGNIDLILQNATRDDLSQSDLSNLADWENNIENDMEEDGWISLLRKFVMLIGILFTVWVLLVYIAYWFDRLNTFFDLDLLGILTIGMLHISDTEEECTFHINDLGQEKSNGRTVNHRSIFTICVIGLGFGVLLISGVFYTFVATIVNTVRNFLG